MPTRPQRRPSQNAKYHLLNMGRTKFGDCIVVQIAGKTILIDCGHPGDYKDNDERPSIPSQLGTILNTQPPFHFDLVVVTHCHLDHIGCLPKLITERTITCDIALVADEKLGFGLDANGQEDDRLADAPQQARALAAAFAEEDHSSLSGSELGSFLQDAASLQDNYRQMLDFLQRGRTRLVRYRQGTPSEQREVQQIVDDMSDTGLVIFGPTSHQLAVCAEVLQRASGDVIDMLGSVADATDSPAELYRHLMENRSDALDIVRSSAGAAKNCQSIVLAFGPPGQRALLPGDMQFALPQIRGFEQDLSALQRAVAEHGPYALVKLPHHSSDNGTNQQLLEAYGWPELLAHSGGYNDPTHPNPDTLTLLKGLVRAHPFTYGRTDRNGMMTIDPTGGAQSGFVDYKGRLNDFTPNKKADDLEAPPAEAGLPANVPQGQTSTSGAVASGSEGLFVDVVFARIPYADGRVSIDGRTVEIERPPSVQSPPRQQNDRGQPGPLVAKGASTTAAVPSLQPPSTRLAGGRTLPQLLFVTDPDRLGVNLGPDGARMALALIETAGHQLVKGTGANLIDATRAAIRPDHKGIVILGGYDVVPSQRVDVLDPALRAQLSPDLIARDPDGFVVWSDDVYGDKEPDGIPELPVSRIPDARLADFFLSQLTTSATPNAGRFGLRNVARPFATPVYDLLRGGEEIFVSMPTQPAALQGQQIAKTNVYLMLHGDYRNSTTFWGEDDNGAIPAMDVGVMPSAGVGVAFAGCCWGALTVAEPAFLGAAQPTPRMVERSLALSFLKAGANAFVGTTGVHYSPSVDGGFFGGPLHTSFWNEVSTGTGPAQALFNARTAYLKAIPHGRTALFDLAVERKIYKEFTCLGLGW